MTAANESGRAIAAGEMELGVAHHRAGATMTARKLGGIDREGHRHPDRADVRPATAGPMTRAPLNIAELSATALPMSSRPDHLDRERLADGHVDRVDRADEQGQQDEQRDRRVPGMTSDTARMTDRHILIAWVPSSVWRLGRLSASTPPNRPKIMTGMNWAAATTPSHSGSWVSTQDEPRLGDLLHPGARPARSPGR